MELPVSGAEPWRCFNIHVPSCNEQVESNVSVSQRSRGPACHQHPNGGAQTLKGVFVMYELHGRFTAAPMGEMPAAWETQRPEAAGSLMRLHIVYIIKVPPRFRAHTESVGLSGIHNSHERRSPHSFSVPFNHVTYWLTETNGARLRFLLLACGWQNTKEAFGAAPSQLGEQVFGRNPGETPAELTRSCSLINPYLDKTTGGSC